MRRAGGGHFVSLGFTAFRKRQVRGPHARRGPTCLRGPGVDEPRSASTSIEPEARLVPRLVQRSGLTALRLVDHFSRDAEALTRVR